MQQLPNSTKVKWFQFFQRGQTYMKTWPYNKRLAPIFPENRIGRVTRFAVRCMPPIAIFTLSWQIALGGQLGPSLATALFACSLPMQGLWWLGKRSVTILPSTLEPWFFETRQKLVEGGIAFEPLNQKPTYQHLAEVLNQAFKQLDKTFLDDL